MTESRNGPHVLRVVVAEDAVVIRRRLVAMLTELGDVEVVRTATTGRGAIEAIERDSPHVAILDLRMPGGSGVDVLRECRAWYRGVLIVFSAFADEMTRERCVEAGADHVFDKSAELGALLDRVRELRDRIVRR